MKKKELAVPRGEWSFRVIMMDLLVCFVGAFLVSFAFFYFSNYNEFAPGGVAGIATMVGSLLAKYGIGEVTLNMGLIMFGVNLPLLVMLTIWCEKKSGVMLLVYILMQTGILAGLEYLHVHYGLPYYAAFPSDPLYVEGNNLAFAVIGVGIVSGVGYAVMLRRFAASGGTYAISALIKHFHPEMNVAWLAFAMDAAVVALAFFFYGSGVNALIGTLTNIFLANLVVDYVLQGVRSGYKFEIITNNAEELSQELMTRLNRGLTLIHAEGMYTHSEKQLLVCIVRKRQIGECLKILKKYNATFSYSCKVTEVYGRFDVHPQEK
jgi:uncharacterized membrane-anchored protein YitT (DUF2179 family)